MTNEKDYSKIFDEENEIMTRIFRSCSVEGLHLINTPTGSGKSYRIAWHTCFDWSQQADRIVLIFVQHKLAIETMERLIDFSNDQKAHIKSEDILYIKSNKDVAFAAIRDEKKPFRILIDYMRDIIKALYKEKGGDLEKKIKTLEERVIKLQDLLAFSEFCRERDKPSYADSKLSEDINQAEKEVRSVVKDIMAEFMNYKDFLCSNCPKLFENLLKQLKYIYPQISFAQKKVIVLILHKAYWGTDPILDDIIGWTDLPLHRQKKAGKTIVVLDESDQAARALRYCIISEAIERSREERGFGGIHDHFLQYYSILLNYKHLSLDYLGTKLEEGLPRIRKKVDREIEKSRIALTEGLYNDILLGEGESIEPYRSGTFLAGDLVQFDLGSNKESSRRFIIHEKGTKYYTERAAGDEKRDENKGKWRGVFIKTEEKCIGLILKFLCRTAEESWKHRMKLLKQQGNGDDGNVSFEDEVHTLVARFGKSERDRGMIFNQIMKVHKNGGRVVISADDGDNRGIDSSVHNKGIRLYTEQLQQHDRLHRIQHSLLDLPATAEKLLLKMLKPRGGCEISVVLCSATAMGGSLRDNFDIEYLRQQLPAHRFHTISKNDLKRLSELQQLKYPNGWGVDVCIIKNTVWGQVNALPEQYYSLFPSDAVELAKLWYNLSLYTLRGTGSVRGADSAKIPYQLERLIRFAQVYKAFWDHKDLRSLIRFQNNRPDKMSVQYHIIACLIDGSWKDYCENEDPKSALRRMLRNSFGNEDKNFWRNAHLRMDVSEQGLEKVKKELEVDPKAKIMLITAYGSLKAGVNLQYKVHPNLIQSRKVLLGAKREEAEQDLMDWEGYSLEDPTGYLWGEPQTSDERNAFLLDVALHLTMLRERGFINREFLRHWINRALKGNNFWFGTEPKQCGELLYEKDVRKFFESCAVQSLGRGSRTTNKPMKTYIFIEEKLSRRLPRDIKDSPVTPEYRELINFLSLHEGDDALTNEELVSTNHAFDEYKQELAVDQLGYLVSRALFYYNREWDDEEEDTKWVAEQQKILRDLKEWMIQHPVISDYGELNALKVYYPRLDECYGRWDPAEWRNDECDGDDVYTRLDIFVRNPDIRSFFEKKGIALTWAEHGLRIHPKITHLYTGEIGEQAFLALLYHIIDCVRKTDQNEGVAHNYDIRRPDGELYEVADFIISCDGKDRVAFDVKNLRPEGPYIDNAGDVPTTMKREEKKRRLGIPLMVVNMVEIEGGSADPCEIAGLLYAKVKDDSGRWVMGTRTGMMIPEAKVRIENAIRGKWY